MRPAARGRWERALLGGSKKGCRSMWKVVWFLRSQVSEIEVVIFGDELKQVQVLDKRQYPREIVPG